MEAFPITNFANSQRTIRVLLENLELEEKTFGQLYLVEVMPGEKVGNHYHENKGEWLIPLQGNAKIILEDIKTKKRREFLSDSPQSHKKISIPPYIAHSVINNSDKPLLILEYSTKPFNPQKEDKTKYEVNE